LANILLYLCTFIHDYARIFIERPMQDLRGEEEEEKKEKKNGKKKKKKQKKK
jgi:hypothetical protein